MRNNLTYWELLQEKGFPMSNINPGSNEFALPIIETLESLKLLDKEKKAILGGDVLVENNGTLIYIYQLLGDEYIYLNWYCDRLKNETYETYLKRSLSKARKEIENLLKIENQHNKKIYIVLVTEG
ncbi:Imm40 family immunity protein [Riemerella anatipestifer]|nr:Imm40 family immunity protein [Riemerella anatipestifer]